MVAKTATGEIVGVLTLNECSAIYACGNFGEISELYVDASHRSSGVGAKLIEAAKEFGILRGWSEIEVGAPHQPKWQRTVNFYMSQGFGQCWAEAVSKTIGHLYLLTFCPIPALDMPRI